MAQVDFGFEKIPVAEKRKRVRNLFEKVAQRYDVMNDFMTFGLHRAWKREMVVRLAPQAHEALLDAAGGTGDVAFRFLAAGGDKATVTDISEAMLNVGKTRAIKTGDRSYPNNRIKFIEDDMENSSLESRQFHCATCAWGLRNTTHPNLAIAEIFRSLRFGGRFFVLEFTPRPYAALAPIYDFWCSRAIPKIGASIAGDESSYRYLVESIQRFIPPEKMQAELEAAGFRQCRFALLAGGVAAIHWGWKL